MKAILSRSLDNGERILTIESGMEFVSSERWGAFSHVIKDYWQTILNLTHHLNLTQQSPT